MADRGTHRVHRDCPGRDGDIEVGTGSTATGGQTSVLKIPERRSSGRPTRRSSTACTSSPDDGKSCRSVDSYFGMRKISARQGRRRRHAPHAQRQAVFQFGPLDQGFWPDGLYTAPTDEALKYDIEMTKKLGFNMIRKHVKVEPDRWYYWCDKLGLLVWQDMPSGDRNDRRRTRPQTSQRTTESAEQYRDRAGADDHRGIWQPSLASSCGCRSTKAGASSTPPASPS